MQGPESPDRTHEVLLYRVDPFLLQLDQRDIGLSIPSGHERFVHYNHSWLLTCETAE